MVSVVGLVGVAEDVWVGGGVVEAVVVVIGAEVAAKI